MKKVKFNLMSVDGNAFSLMGHFQRAALKAGWTRPEVKVVLDQCMSGDYDNLVATLSTHCK